MLEQRSPLSLLFLSRKCGDFSGPRGAAHWAVGGRLPLGCSIAIPQLTVRQFSQGAKFGGLHFKAFPHRARIARRACALESAATPQSRLRAPRWRALTLGSGRPGVSSFTPRFRPDPADLDFAPSIGTRSRRNGTLSHQVYYLYAAPLPIDRGLFEPGACGRVFRGLRLLDTSPPRKTNRRGCASKEVSSFSGLGLSGGVDIDC
jgi:hypothetical protein